MRVRLQTCEHDLREASADAASLCTRLRAVLSAAGHPVGASADLDELLGAARSVVTREQDLQAMRSRLSDRERQLARRQRDLEQASAAERVWQEAWDAACSRCWLSEGGTRRTTAEVRGLLEAVAELGPLLERHAGLTDRIGKMEADRAAFAQAVAAAAAGMPTIDASGSPADVATRLDEAVRHARSQRAKLAKLSDDIGLARAEKERLAAAAASHARRAAEMAEFLGASSLDEIDIRLRQLERRAELIGQARAAERDIAAGIGSQTIAEAEALLDGLDREDLEAELAAAQVRFSDQDQRTRDGFAALRKAEDQLEAIGGDGAVARIEEAKRTTLLEVTEKALRYLRLRTGIAAAEQALRLYRERHRSSMMAAASDAFHLLSCGKYNLASRPERNGETLIAVTPAGGSKTAPELSRGTRFQLYLALRVAAFREFARSQQPLPFITDDIMETFDDLRAEAAFRALAGMAESGQVIYLTHHPHLCRIATLVCPMVKIHALEPLPPER